MKTGDLIYYRGLEDEGNYRYAATGLCLREEIDPDRPTLGIRMLVMWFDDHETTYECLDVCDRDDWMEIISESR